MIILALSYGQVTCGDELDVQQLIANHEDWEFDDRQRQLLADWGFSVFADTRAVPQNDIHLIIALVERWRPETNTFHFSFGEMTITPEDVYMIMGLPVKGRALTHEELTAPKTYWMTQWHDSRLDENAHRLMYNEGVVLHKLRTWYKKKPEVALPQDDIVYTRAYLFYIIGSILFPSSSGHIVHPRYLHSLHFSPCPLYSI